MRKLVKQLAFVAALGSIVALQGCAGSGAGTVSAAQVDADSQNAAITSARSFRLFRAFALTVIGSLFSASSDLQFDGNLYYSTTQDGNTITVSYFSDAARTKSAGTVVATLQSQQTFPFNVKLAINITGGSRPTSGQGLIVVMDPDANFAKLSGNVTETGVGGINPIKMQFSLLLDTQNSKFTGSMDAAVGASRLSIGNLVLTRGTDQALAEGDVKVGSVSAHEQMALNDDQSGSFSIPNKTSEAWKPDGSGSVTLPSGVVHKIQNIDNGQ